MEEIQKTQSSPRYDAVIVDAYADDSVPQHLMTKEAFALYASLLRTDGMLIVHISSRYLNLVPVLIGNAESNAMKLYFRNDKKPVGHATPSLWAVLTRDTAEPQPLLISQFTDSLGEKVIYWDDTHSSVFPIVRWGM